MTITSLIGCGGEVTGEAVVFPAREVVSRDMTMDLSGKILIMQTPVSKECLEKARFVGVVGVVVPSIHYRDFDYFKSHGDFVMMVLSRFGNDSIDGATLEKVSKMNGKSVKLSGEGKKLESP